MKNTLRQRIMAVWCLWGIVAIGLTLGHAGSVSGCQDEDANLTETETSPQDEPRDLSEFKPVEVPEPPLRELRVIEQVEPWTSLSMAPSDELKAKKFAAVLEIKSPQLTAELMSRLSSIESNYGMILSRLDAGKNQIGIPIVSETILGRGEHLFSVHLLTLDDIIRRQASQSLVVPSLSHYFKSVSELVPDSRRPSEAALQFLSSPAVEQMYRTDNFANRLRLGEPPLIVLFVTSAEEAEEVGNAVMTLFDYGVTYRMQQDLLERWQTEWKQGQGLAEKLAAAELVYAKHQTELAKLEQIPRELMETIYERRYNLDVDVQGVEARNAAILEAMEKENVSSVLRTRLVEMQVEAQIELRGLVAQRDKLAEMIDVHKRSIQLEADRNKTGREVSSLQTRLTSLPTELELFRIASEFVQPLEVKNNEIRLHPAQWVDETPSR